jgi:hypothetical protein
MKPHYYSRARSADNMPDPPLYYLTASAIEGASLIPLSLTKRPVRVKIRNEVRLAENFGVGLNAANGVASRAINFQSDKVYSKVYLMSQPLLK